MLQHANRSNHRWLLRWLLLALIAMAACASAAPPLTLRFESLGVEQGLTQETVTALLQDHRGYLWIGSQAGLSRYDGYRVISFKKDPANPASLTDNYVQALFEDGQGRLWVGSKGGLDRYDASTRSFVHFAVAGKLAPANNHSINCIVGDGRQGLWLCSAEGLLHFDTVTGQFQIYQREDANAANVGDDRINALALDRRGELWVATDGGLKRLAAGSARFLRQAVGPAGARDKSPAVLALSLAGDDTLWLGTTEGLQAWRLGAAAPQQIALAQEQALPSQKINALLRDRDGILWIATFADGIKRLDPASGRVYHYRHESTNRHSVGHNRVNALYQDRTGTLWVGTWYAGLDRVDLASGGFERYTEFAGVLPRIGGNQVRAIAADGEHRLWVGTSEGLSRLDLASGALEVWQHDPKKSGSMPDDRVFALDTDQRGRLWIGTASGLGWRDPQTGLFTSLKLGDDPLRNFIQHVLVDRRGTIWAGSRAGLFSIDPATLAVRAYLHDPKIADSLTEGRILTLLEDKHGVLWLGMENGLDRFNRNTGQFLHYRHDPANPNSLTHNRVHSLFDDEKGNLWLGTAAGLCKAELDANGVAHFRFYGATNKRAPNPIGAILGDASGGLWISTTSGISRFDPGSGAFRDYTSKDGLLDGSYFIGSAFKSADGVLYFGGLTGMTAFRPERIYGNPYPPQVSITDFTIGNLSVLSGASRTVASDAVGVEDSRELSYRDSVFAFEFAGLHFADPLRNRYAYQLEGFDSDWVLVNADRRFAAYTNLDPGHYVFRVRAANKDGVWSAGATSMAITIAPPFWKTWWFRTLVVGAAFGVSYVVLRIRIRMLVAQKHGLELEVRHRTRELVLQKDSAERQKHEVERQKESVELAHRHMSQLSEIGRKITANLDSEAIMTMLYQEVDELMDASVFGIGIYRPEAELIEYPFAMEKGKRYTPYTRSMCEPNQLAVWCIVHAKEVFINDLEHEYAQYISDLSHVSSAEDMGTLEDGSLPTEPQSLIYVPILVAGQVRGVITVHSYHGNAYQRFDLDMLNTLASYVAVAFDNADAYRQLKDTQQQLVAREKLAGLGALVAGVAHELNTPIGNSLVIASTLESKTEEIAAKNDSQTMRRSDLNGFIAAAREASTLLMRSLHSAAELVHSFKQVAVDQASAKRRNFNLLQATQEVLTTFMSQIRKAGHRVELEMPDDIEMDSFPGPFGQVIINLTNNAVLHAFDGRSGGLMRITANRLGAERVRVVFHDNGIGIQSEHLARIFDPFFTTKLGQGGNGLGLSITYNIVTSLLGGHIRVESEIGSGTAFIIDLPLTATLAGE